MKAKILLLSALAAVGMMFTSCDDDDDNGSLVGTWYYAWTDPKGGDC